MVSGAATLDNGGGIDPMVGGDLADCMHGKALLAVKTKPTLIMMDR
jgi:hypothetical protein